MKRIAVLGLVLVGSVSMAQPQTVNQNSVPFIGTWKVNLEKSNYSPFPAPKSSVLMIEDRGDGLFEETRNVVLADDGKSFASYVLKCDDKDYPFLQTGPQYYGGSFSGFISCTASDSKTFDFAVKTDTRRVLQHFIRTLSSDGTMFIETIPGSLPAAATVFDKQ